MNVSAHDVWQFAPVDRTSLLASSLASSSLLDSSLASSSLLDSSFPIASEDASLPEEDEKLIWGTSSASSCNVFSEDTSSEDDEDDDEDDEVDHEEEDVLPRFSSNGRPGARCSAMVSVDKPVPVPIVSSLLEAATSPSLVALLALASESALVSTPVSAVFPCISPLEDASLESEEEEDDDEDDDDDDDDGRLDFDGTAPTPVEYG